MTRVQVRAQSSRGGRPRTLFFFYTTSMAHLFTPMARWLKETQGWKIVFITTYKGLLPNPKLYDFDLGVFDDVVYCGELLRPRPVSEMPDASALATAAQELERRLGVSALDIVRVDRMVGIDFVTGAHFHRAKIGKQTNYAQSIDLALRLCRFWEDQLTRHHPEAVLSYPGSIFTNALISVGEAMGTPMRFLWPPRRGNGYAWIADRWGWPNGIRTAYEHELARLTAAAAIAEPPPDGAEALAPSQRFTLLRDRLSEEATAGALGLRIYKQLRRHLPNVMRGRQTTYDSYLITDRIRHVIDEWSIRRRAMREKPKLPEIAEGTPFVFFPLHTEPEISTMVECAAADNQLTFVDWLAKTMPAGWYLLIKEHPMQASRRLSGFWEQIRRYPNVIVLSTLERAEEILPRAKAVAVINSTVGFQAAAQGIPVITFHEHFLPTLMPHVRHANSYQTTRQALRDVRDGKIYERHRRLIAARAFLNAMARFEFPVSNQEMLAGRPARTPMDPAEFDGLMAAFLESLDGAGGEHSLVDLP